MPTTKWVESFNRAMVNFLKIHYREFLGEEELENHVTIPKNSRLAREWLFPGKRLKFLDIFMVKNMQRGYFDGNQWSEIESMMIELKNQAKLSKVGINSLKAAARTLDIPYWKAKQYFRKGKDLTIDQKKITVATVRPLIP